MQLEDIKCELVQESYLSRVKVYENIKINKKKYPVVVKCNIEVLNEYYPIIIGIHEDWAQKLVDIYVDTDDVIYIPHIDREKKLCLFDLEGVIIEENIIGILKQCIRRAKELLISGLSQDNWNDFLYEFDSYIACLPNCKILKVVMPDNKKTQKMYYCLANKIDKNRRTKEKYSAYLERIKEKSYFASYDSKDFNTWGYTNTIRRGLFVSIKPEHSIYPPKYNKNFNLDDLNSILSYIEPFKEIEEFFNENRSDKFLIIGIEQPEGIFNAFGVLIKEGFFVIDSKVICKSAQQIIPLLLERLDEESLLSRTSYDKNKLSDKKYLLIGCGSIGGYLFYNLIKSGCKNIDLVDPDMLRAENIYRHLLGIEYIGNYKVEALRIFGEKNIPNLNIKAIVNKIQDSFEENDIHFEDYDYIIAATGNEILNRWINDYIFKNNILAPVLYIWNEPLDIGSHVAIIQKGRAGCYDCFFKRNNLGELSNIMSYCKPGQEFTKNISGCGGSYIPYGSLLSIQSGLLFMDILKKYSEGRIKENMIISEKGDDFHFSKAELDPSDRYITQKCKVKSVLGTEFKNKKCKVCGVNK